MNGRHIPYPESTDQTNSCRNSSQKTWLAANAATHQSLCNNKLRQQQTAARSKNISAYFRPAKIARSHALTTLRTKPRARRRCSSQHTTWTWRQPHSTARRCKRAPAEPSTQRYVHITLLITLTSTSLAVDPSNNSGSYSSRHFNATETTFIIVSQTNTELNASHFWLMSQINSNKQPPFQQQFSRLTLVLVPQI